MRLSYVALAVGALAIQTAAVPIRVVVVTTKQDVSAHDSLNPGHPDFGVASVFRPVTTVTHIGQTGAGRVKHKCGKLAEKAAQKSGELMEMFREAFGFQSHSKVKALPIHFDGPHRVDGAMVKHFADPYESLSNDAGGAVQKGGHHGHHAHAHGHHQGSFLRRINRALMSLGTWEGRVVAFVLGCGIGVLIRMVWVLTVVVVRAFRGSKEEEYDTDSDTTFYEGVVLFDESSLPPHYTPPPPTAEVVFADEKKDASASDN
ncbi:hypothetical protein EUX98_g5416 [Antrodiella citrinella]|uniref:Uncharacterized protein n=1 Tax=Antrodiella citrinella TaxID=2447956 RepID=A0A4S4MRH5_9APHY|nr:hypothetical protein EUX98_g5416 [Antrodiella citrinella]